MNNRTLRITPKTQEQAMQSGLLEKGNYHFQVKKAELKHSKNGNPMVELMLQVWSDKGDERFIYDYLLATEDSDRKIRHFCYSVGLGKMSESGEFDCDAVLDKHGQCKVYIREDKTGQYPPKNAVSDYIIDTKQKQEEQFIDDNLPF